MPLVWRDGGAYTAVDDGDPQGAPVCVDPSTDPPTFSGREVWERLTWELFHPAFYRIGGTSDAWTAEARVNGLVKFRMHVNAAFSLEQVKACIEAVRVVLTPLPANIHESTVDALARRRELAWTEIVDPQFVCDRSGDAGSRHVWDVDAPIGARCRCGRRRRQARSA